MKQKIKIGGTKSVEEMESNPYYISSDFFAIYFPCIQIWFSAFNDYISKNMVFGVLIIVAGEKY